MDLSTLTDAELSTLRQDLTAERDRRRKIAQLPENLAAMARDAVAAGCDPDELLDGLTDALTQEGDPADSPPATGE